MNTKQQHAFDTVVAGKSIVLTGPAGTGKTFTLKAIIKWTRVNRKTIGVTASTGLAAFLLQGRTVHSFLGIGLATKNAETLALHVQKRLKETYLKLQKLDILIIDEISMIDAELFTKISEFLCIIRGVHNQPFGGLQLILTGDFCQLPPVNGKYCFQSDIWKALDIDIVILEELTRQSDDKVFQDILQELRWGDCSAKTYKVLQGLKETSFDNGIMPTRLFPINVDVDKINQKEYASLVEHAGPQDIKVFQTKYSSHPQTQTWCNSMKVPEKVEVCIGAQVMVTCNVREDILNGTRGVVVGFSEDGVVIQIVDGTRTLIEFMKIACEDNDKMHCSLIPLKLAYAISIHKSQGMTLDAVEIDLGSNVFEYGQAYTALSRAKTLASIKLLDVRKKSFKTNPLVKEFYSEISST